jgi:hypothetical protein
VVGGVCALLVAVVAFLGFREYQKTSKSRQRETL